MRALLAILALFALAPAAAAAPHVEIRRTSHGIPHIKAKTFYGAAYGYGYAFAQDNLCEIAETAGATTRRRRPSTRTATRT